MKKNKPLLTFLLLLFALFLCNKDSEAFNLKPLPGQNNGAGESSINEIILIGDDQLIIIDYTKSTAEKKHITWQIKSSDIIDLPAAFKKYFKTLDDAKSVDNNTKLLISSSGGGVALVDRKTKKCLFYAKAPMAHSVEYLPGGRIATALSTASKGGNRVEIYDSSQSDTPLFTDSLYSGHGLSWNKERNLLYALGFDKLRAYSLRNWTSQKPELVLEKEWSLPETGGHDLFAPSSDKLLLSTSSAVWEFNIDKERFGPFNAISKEKSVKSIYFDEKTQEIVYTKGEISWWTHQIHFLNPKKIFLVPELNLYKVRIIKKRE